MDERKSFAAALDRSQRYVDHDGRRHDPLNPRIYASVRAGPVAVRAMIDTGAPWCIVPPPFGPEASESDPVHDHRVRGDLLPGRLTRGRLTLVADDGADLDLEVTFFVPGPEYRQDWSYPFFVGLQALQGLRIGIDAPRSLLHFGASHP